MVRFRFFEHRRPAVRTRRRIADILFTVITYHSEPLFFILNTNRTRSVILVFGMKPLFYILYAPV